MLRELRSSSFGAAWFHTIGHVIYEQFFDPKLSCDVQEISTAMRVGIHPVIFLLDNGQYVIEEQVRAALSSEALFC